VVFGSSCNNDENFINLTVPQNNSHKNSADGQTDIPEKLKAAKQDEQTSLEVKSPRIQFIWRQFTEWKVNLFKVQQTNV